MQHKRFKMKNADKPINPIFEDNLINPGYSNDTQLICIENGLTKREYFAGLAMQGILANSSLNNLKEETVAEISVLCADKLLENLENTK